MDRTPRTLSLGQRSRRLLLAGDDALAISAVTALVFD